MLEQWSKELMATSIARQVDPPPDRDDWLGFEPASPDSIAAAESRLGVLLPPSYKSFLAVSDGWRALTPFIYRVRPIDEVDWFRVENEHWVDAFNPPDEAARPDLPDHEYFTYGKGDDDDGRSHDFRSRHLRSMLQISDVGDGVWLLNPEAVTPDGEWEAWFFANWIPGAHRYASFAHMLVSEYKSFRRLENVAGRLLRLPRVRIPAPDVPRVPAERVRAKQPKAGTLDDLIEQIRRPAADKKAFDKTLRTFFGKLRGRPSAARRPDLVAPLTELFDQSNDANVRAACIAALTEVADDPGDDGRGPAPLLDALSDPDPSVVLQGIFALHYFPDRRAIAPLCKFVNTTDNHLYRESAISHLGIFGDPAAIPALLKVLHDPANQMDQNYASAGIALGQLGGPAVEHLIRALDSPDWRVRHAAVCGLDVSRDARAQKHLERMRNDPDARVSQRAGMRAPRFPPEDQS